MPDGELPIRWRDLDPYGHVNHAVYVTYLEELRDAWLSRRLALGDAVWEYVVARIALDYRRELHPADGPVRAEFAVERLGRTSITTRAAADGDGDRGGERPGGARRVRPAGREAAAPLRRGARPVSNRLLLEA